MNRTRPSTIVDVARLAKVSSATVSRALRGHANVTLATRERVEKAARTLNYRADPSASRLASRRSSSVALVLPVLDSWYFSAVMAGVEAELTPAGYELALFVTRYDATRHRLMANPMARETGGMILIDVALAGAEAAHLLEGAVPAVSIGMEFEGMSSVIVDDEAIGREATQHLLELGHTAIALLSGSSDDRFGFTVATRRRNGYQNAMDDAGRRARRDLEVDGKFTVAGGYEAMGCLLALDDPPTAVFSMSDEMAFGALKAARDHGLQVPNDLSIVGVDDHPMSWIEDLTTVQQHVTEHGAFAAREVLDRMDQPPRPPTRIQPSTSLIVRNSTAPLA